MRRINRGVGKGEETGKRFSRLLSPVFSLLLFVRIAIFRAEKRSAQFFCAYPFAGASELKALPFDSVVEQLLLW